MKYEMMHPADKLVLMMSRVYLNRMTSTSGGNLSIIDENGDIWITPSGYDKGSLTRADIMCIRADGKVIGPHKPSMEFPFHQSVYRMRPDIKTVFHAHPPAVITFSLVRKIPHVELIPEVLQLCGRIVMAPYAVPGSTKLGDYISEKFKDGYNTVEMENHGICIGTEDIFKSYRIFEALENFAKIELNALRLGPLDDSSVLSCGASSFPAYGTFKRQAPGAEESAVRRDLISYIHRACRQHLFTSAQGTYSAVLSDGSFIITPADKDREWLEVQDLVRVKDGRCEEGKIPGSTAYFHGLVYSRHSDIKSITCSLPPNMGAFTISGTLFDPRLIPETYMVLVDMKTVLRTDFFMAPAKTAALFEKSCPVLLVKNTCLVTTGPTIVKAFDRMEVADYAAESVIAARALGSIVHIDGSDITDLDKAFDLK
ncbi:MAG: class II aldolase/adducin family protein [Treponema sp.]